LEPSIQEAKTLGEENRERIDAVDKRAQQGINTATDAAKAADQRAATAQKAADAAQTAAQAADRKADTANQGVQQASNRLNTLESRVAGIDTYTESAKEAVTFRLNSSALDDQARSTLDNIASGLAGAKTGYMVEIQGYTDSTGSEQYNIGLSQRRAEAVQRYLVSKNIPLYRISIVGLGEESPVADNKTSQGRAQNRRVEVRVLRSAGAKQTN
jgi:outer membrane protein OmpA-like peptidoglycan-associated protein